MEPEARKQKMDFVVRNMRIGDTPHPRRDPYLRQKYLTEEKGN